MKVAEGNSRELLGDYAWQIYFELQEKNPHGTTLEHVTAEALKRHSDLVNEQLDAARWRYMHDICKQALANTDLALRLVVQSGKVEQPYLPGTIGAQWERVPTTITVEINAGSFARVLKSKATAPELRDYWRILDEGIRADSIKRDAVGAILELIAPFNDDSTPAEDLLARLPE